MKITKLEHSYTVLNRNGYMVVKYKTKQPVKIPDGSEKEDITAVGRNLPESKGIFYEMTGEFEEYEDKKTGKMRYSFKVQEVSEMIPSEEDGIKSYLRTLKGVGPVLAESMFHEFGKDIFKTLEKEPEKLCVLKTMSLKKAQKIQKDYLLRTGAQQLFKFLFQFGIKESQIMRIYQSLGQDAFQIVKNNPYEILSCGQVGFSTADLIAKKEGFRKDDERRIGAGILEVLGQSEKGGSLFAKHLPFPEFMLNSYLRKPIFDLMEDETTYHTGNTYLPRNILYLLTLRLLDIPVDENRFDEICLNLHKSKKIFISVDRKADDEALEKVKVYRFPTAIAEYRCAENITKLSGTKLKACDKLLENIYSVEKTLSIRLSDQQRSAVKTAMSHPVSVITGGPGTGKTSVQNTIIETFRMYYPEEEILLMAPTGRAAKRMYESTGYPAATLHKSMMLYADSDGGIKESAEDFRFKAKLIIVDETSMIGIFLMDKLLSHIQKGTRLVLVGDIDQLPSIETGAVLRELIDCGKIPVTRLTKTFRQASGSVIATNAARIKIGEQKLEMGSEFKFYADETSETILDTVCSLVPQMYEEYGPDEVMCLTAYRKKTASGTNSLNLALRDVLRSDITESTQFFEKAGIKFYEGDRVMNTKNTHYLTNGDIGVIRSIIKNEDSLVVNCEFDGVFIPLEDDEVNSLELAYALTVHKAQGSEAKCVILIADLAHKNMLTRPLFYTGVSRARQKIFIVGQPEATKIAIRTQDSSYRRCNLGNLIVSKMNGLGSESCKKNATKSVEKASASGEEQLKINI